ncbi:MAG: protein-disulfide reductase DsbD N-terminal domain-containing protein [Betaproteobacteria bacterium]|nr:protein-disulfide reductase DsbD N-terminal domain-containing protein [Betaproteobacteria bacterium]
MKRSAESSRRLAFALLGCALAAVQPARANDDLLPADEAFRATARVADARWTEVRFEIAPGHYLYRQRFAIEAGGKRVANARLVFPKGHVKQDPTFGRVETHEGVLVIKLRGATPDATGKLLLGVTAQGCAEQAGVCYPPFTQVFELNRSAGEWVAARQASLGSIAGQSALKSLVQKP